MISADGNFPCPYCYQCPMTDSSFTGGGLVCGQCAKRIHDGELSSKLHMTPERQWAFDLGPLLIRDPSTHSYEDKVRVHDAICQYDVSRHKWERKRSRRSCDVCGRRGAILESHFRLCGDCGERRYCSVDCQREDWFFSGHREECARLAGLEEDARRT